MIEQIRRWVIAVWIKVTEFPFWGPSVREIKNSFEEAHRNEVHQMLWDMVKSGKAKVVRGDDGTDRFIAVGDSYDDEQ